MDASYSSSTEQSVKLLIRLVVIDQIIYDDGCRGQGANREKGTGVVVPEKESEDKLKIGRGVTESLPRCIKIKAICLPPISLLGPYSSYHILSP